MSHPKAEADNSIPNNNIIYNSYHSLFNFSKKFRMLFLHCKMQLQQLVLFNMCTVIITKTTTTLSLYQVDSNSHSSGSGLSLLMDSRSSSEIGEGRCPKNTRPLLTSQHGLVPRCTTLNAFGNQYNHL